MLLTGKSPVRVRWGSLVCPMIFYAAKDFVRPSGAEGCQELQLRLKPCFVRAGPIQLVVLCFCSPEVGKDFLLHTTVSNVTISPEKSQACAVGSRVKLNVGTAGSSPSQFQLTIKVSLTSCPVCPFAHIQTFPSMLVLSIMKLQLHCRQPHRTNEEGSLHWCHQCDLEKGRLGAQRSHVQFSVWMHQLNGERIYAPNPQCTYRFSWNLFLGREELGSVSSFTWGFVTAFEREVGNLLMR